MCRLNLPWCSLRLSCPLVMLLLPGSRGQAHLIPTSIQCLETDPVPIRTKY